MFVPYIDPITKEKLFLENHCYRGLKSSSQWPIVRSIPRFCDSKNYTENFGYQWNIFDKNQIDSYSNIKQSEQRFYLETDWNSDELENQKIPFTYGYPNHNAYDLHLKLLGYKDLVTQRPLLKLLFLNHNS